jgi:hypothetical protein
MFTELSEDDYPRRLIGGGNSDIAPELVTQVLKNPEYYHGLASTLADYRDAPISTR